MSLGQFGSFSSPEIDRESDLLREIAQLLAVLERIAVEAAAARLFANDDELRDWLMAIRDLARAAIAKSENKSPCL